MGLLAHSGGVIDTLMDRLDIDSVVAGAVEDDPIRGGLLQRVVESLVRLRNGSPFLSVGERLFFACATRKTSSLAKWSMGGNILSSLMPNSSM